MFFTFCSKTNGSKSQNTPDTGAVWLENKRVKQFLRFHYHIISVTLFQLLSLHKSLVHPPFICILYDECREDVKEEYSSAKYTMTKLRNF